MRAQPLPATFHSNNRQKLADAVGPAAVAVIDTADVLRRPGDFEYPFRPDSNFYYLTGIGEPEAVLVLAPGHPNPKFREILFIRQTDEVTALWSGQGLSQKAASNLSGVKTVMWLSELPSVLERLVGQFRAVYLNATITLQPGPLGPSARRAKALRHKLPTHQLHSVLEILGPLRATKDPAEVGHIRRAVEITGAGLQKAWTAMRPGLPEYALEAELTAEFTRQGASAPAFSAIVAAGKNATVIHSVTCATEIAKNDLVLFDVGAEFGYYAADITRTVPVSGRFSERQRAVYEAVYRVQQAGIALHKPGANIAGIDIGMRKLLIQEIVGLGLITAAMAKGPDADQHLHKYYPHISHHLGLDVHDTGGSRLELAPGMVVTCEPGLYLPEEGIGVRLEDDILITKSGHEVLSAGIPSAPDEVEQLIQRLQP